MDSCDRESKKLIHLYDEILHEVFFNNKKVDKKYKFSKDEKSLLNELNSKLECTKFDVSKIEDMFNKFKLFIKEKNKDLKKTLKEAEEVTIMYGGADNVVVYERKRYSIGADFLAFTSLLLGFFFMIIAYVRLKSSGMADGLNAVYEALPDDTFIGSLPDNLRHLLTDQERIPIWRYFLDFTNTLLRNQLGNIRELLVSLSNSSLDICTPGLNVDSETWFEWSVQMGSWVQAFLSASDVKDCQMAVFRYNIDIMMQKYSNDFDAIVLFIRYSQVFFAHGITHTGYRLLNYFYRPSVEHYNDYSSEENTPERRNRTTRTYGRESMSLLPSPMRLRSGAEYSSPTTVGNRRRSGSLGSVASTASRNPPGEFIMDLDRRDSMMSDISRGGKRKTKRRRLKKKKSRKKK